MTRSIKIVFLIALISAVFTQKFIDDTTNTSDLTDKIDNFSTDPNQSSDSDIPSSDEHENEHESVSEEDYFDDLYENLADKIQEKTWEVENQVDNNLEELSKEISKAFKTISKNEILSKAFKKVERDLNKVYQKSEETLNDTVGEVSKVVPVVENAFKDIASHSAYLAYHYGDLTLKELESLVTDKLNQGFKKINAEVQKQLK